ncbi:peptidoglycan-binding protein [Clostridium intestinale]|uniref:Peptidoglycan-binding (PGRP) domain of peptidoglycan hydrolases-containing protein n=1 Tax=Clostridium intestinale DSM 6191 TaxID=1121320 RepID=A0A1M6A4B7_9CLOT|nr:peptidoglycan-binding protein [Clostridium intestinale]SHI31179.1 Peptidoglycan-binding (PGRP) domain of peptidoglycan hydrolases-containing protein [Clostridium intestinale DSM 6191]
MLLKSGDKGEFVTYLQYGLYIMCCNPNGFDGDFGQGTVSAVKKFQTNFNLGADGVVGDGTWNALCTQISYIQAQLKTKGYNLDSDGIAGPVTYNTIIQFQASNGLAADGMVGPSTKAKLGNSASTSNNPLLSMGSSGSYVVKLQNLLINYGYSCGAAGADGDFGQGTYNAVVKFQANKGLIVDGMVGPLTWNALESNSSSTPITNYPTLSKGATGSSVIKLQNALISRGYSCGASGADGDFGEGTYYAVILFQQYNGLSADGVVGPQTWNTLYSVNAVNFFDNLPVTKDEHDKALSRFVNIAKGEIGKYKEGKNANGEGNNRVPYVTWYYNNPNMSAEWCAIFVSWCANQAGILNTMIPKMAYVPYLVKWYGNIRYKTVSSGYKPKPGDLFFHHNGREYSHVGIVESYNASDNSITTIEGNVGDTITRRYISLNQSVTSYTIAGFGVN